MNKISVDEIRRSLVDVSEYTVDLGGPDAAQSPELLARVADRMGADAGYCVCYGTNKVLAKHGLDLQRDAETAYQLLESIFKGALARIDLQQFNVTPWAMTFAKMDVDGYNKNGGFSFDNKVPTREFMTSKCLHFDAATPFVGNIYGPNHNIVGGHPLICDVKRFCRDKGIAAGEMVENIPNNYNVVVKAEYYEELIRDYAFALKLNLDTDIVLIMLLNEVEFGVAHGATDPRKRVPDAEAKRPIRHFEFQYDKEEHYTAWYQHYHLQSLDAKDYHGENLSLDYYSRGTAIETIINVGN
jgi:hypothetical protein